VAKVEVLQRETETLTDRLVRQTGCQKDRQRKSKSKTEATKIGHNTNTRMSIFYNGQD
jgi:hypothetical protein